MLLPFVLIYMLLLVNRPRLMGSFRNNGWQNWIALATTVIMVVLTVIFVYDQMVA
jgi:Mn2+/Fe2+ NRAMP family transporter